MRGRVGAGTLRILQVNTLERIRGAAQVARCLHRSYGARGHASFMALGLRQSDDPSVFQIPRIAPPTSATGFCRARGVAKGVAKLAAQCDAAGAARHARARFALDRQADAYLDLYGEVAARPARGGGAKNCRHPA